LAWARAVTLQFDMEYYAEQIKEARLRDDVEGKVEEKVIQQMAELLQESKLEKDVMKTRIKEIKEELK